MKYRAVFFDRDNTLTYFNPEKEFWRDRMLESWSGKTFTLPYEKMMLLFNLAAEGKRPWYRDVEEEKVFFQRYYQRLLENEGIADELDSRAELLFQELWCNDDRLLYPETLPVLRWFRDSGLQMGVISDTSPSLELSLKQLGLGEFFTSYTASSLVGAGKPDPRIYRAALEAQGVSAEESLYVDDCAIEAEGARALGFTAFHLDREGTMTGEWVIHSLEELRAFAEKSIEQPAHP